MDIQQLEKIFDALKTDQHISPDEIPDLDLYMDQVITFLENHLSHTKRKTNDKLLTKTMINNYAKNKLLMPAIKKKYTQDHLLVLALIYELKQVTSLEDIQSLFNLLKTSDSEDHEILHQVYNHYLEMQKTQKQCVKDTLHTLYETKKNTVSSQEDTVDRALLCLLLFEQSLTYKRLAEKLLDEIESLV